ncbi:hypothetical protein D4Q52_11210 [Rhodopseudomonas palustris]|uniref:Uncharacterized protein n=1 Tax=Rhodopseudomonas palustris TaxID=1076 RepID=A0A418VEZ8_RHOPL|nr:hypothetical protein D4Q52_11210 [Rhodopseudomonas palustris]
MRDAQTSQQCFAPTVIAPKAGDPVLQGAVEGAVHLPQCTAILDHPQARVMLPSLRNRVLVGRWSGALSVQRHRRVTGDGQWLENL